MKNNILFILLIFTGLFFACGEKDLTPSEPQTFYEFPQGNADYDQEFLAYYEKYNVQFLYKYKESDFRWNVTEYIPYYSVQADEAYADKAFHFITENSFAIWDEDFLRKILPLRVLLASEIYSVTERYDYVYDEETQEWGSVKVYDTTYHAAASGLNHIAFGHTSEKFDQLTENEKLNATGEITKSLIVYAASRDKIEIPTEFSDLFNNSSNTENQGQWGYNGCGFLEYYKNIDVNYDFGLYVKYLTIMSEDEFKAWALSDSFDVSAEWDQSSGTYKRTYLIKQKYEIVLDYFKTKYNIDLHAIGNQASK
jgi:lipoprotein